MHSVRVGCSLSGCCRGARRWGGVLRGSTATAILASALTLMSAAGASAVICIVPDDGTGTAQLPPNCVTGYLSPDDVHMIINGLPPGTTILVDSTHFKFGLTNQGPGGGLGGEFEQFQSCLQMQMTGTGDLAGFNRFVTICGTQCETHIGPRVRGNAVQSFPNDMFMMQGQIIGDPDFDLLRVTAGTAFGMPSPGHTTLTRQGPPGSNWAVDSFFDITYRIDFVGAPGGALGGMSGSTTATIRMALGGPFTVACCFPSGGCADLAPGDCLAQGGSPQGSGSSCATTPCGGTACIPEPSGQFCQDTVCPGVATCEARCANFNPATGQSAITDCTCLPGNECRVRIPTPGTPTPRGSGNPCVVTDNGSGTVTLPPAGCEYLSPDDVHRIVDGLPAGTTIELAPIHRDFICNRQPGGGGVCSFPLGVDCDQAGGSLGGEQECSDSTLAMQLHGTGTLAGFDRPVMIPLSFETHTAPRTPGNPVQSFDTDMFRMFGQITGDPDFDLLRITGGTDFGMPSPGHTTLTQLPGGNWAVDSFFDITYRIDFIGRPGGPLGGMSGSTTGTIRMATGFGPRCENTCPSGGVCVETRTVQANGTIDICCLCEMQATEACCGVGPIAGGCADLDPTQCQSLGGVPQGPGTACSAPVACCLPDGSCTEVDPLCCDELGGVAQPAGATCADVQCPQPQCEPLPDGTACRDVLCPDDPTGSDACLPHCVRTNPATGQSQVTDCDCRGTFECHAVRTGTPGGAGRGSGNPCVVTDNGGGTVTLPPAGCEYLSPDDVHMIIDGLPAGTTIELGTIHKDFICHKQGTINQVCSFQTLVDCDQPGGSLGGEQECVESTLDIQLTGTGALAGFNRPVQIPIGFETHTAPRTPGNPVQSFDTDMFRLFGQITNPSSGDPDFDLLRIVGGTDFGLPSPGHTTLTQLPGGNWAVDSFFDITYRIDFVGRPGGALSGMSGSTTGTIRMSTGVGASCQGACPPGTVCQENRVVNPDGTIDLCCDCVAPPCPDLIRAASRRPPCDLPLDLVPGLPITTEPRRLTPTASAGGITTVVFTYAAPPPNIPPVIESDCSCPPPPAFAPYGGPSVPSCVVVGNDLICSFTPPLAAPCTYRLRVCSAAGTVPVDVRTLLGDVGGVGGPDGNGLTDATDRSIVVGIWTGTGYSCKTDLNMDGVTNAIDRSIVVGTWTGGANCSP